MKNFTLLLAVLGFINISNSQVFFSEPKDLVEIAPNFDIYVNPYNEDINGCYKSLTISFQTRSKNQGNYLTLDTKEDYTYNDICYKFKFKLYDNNKNLITTINPKNIQNDSNYGTYVYSPVIDLSGLNEAYESFIVEVLIEEYRLVGYPDFMQYIPFGSKYTNLDSSRDFRYNKYDFGRCVTPVDNTDSDNDGVVDSKDKCPGHDDNIDSDGNGIPDGCDYLDSDNDGVPDDEDKCPTEYGQSSNNGCPNYADLVLDGDRSTAIVRGSGQPSNSINLGGTYFTYLGESIQLQLVVRNTGDTKSSNNMKVGIYLSNNSNFSGAVRVKEVTYYNIHPNESDSRTIEIANSTLASYASYNYYTYIHIVVDYKNNVNEGYSGGENNNRFSSVRVKSSYNTRKLLNPKGFKLTSKTDETLINSYNVDVYDFSGILIKSETINSNIEKQHILDNLPSGLFIIKTPNEAKKISK